MTVVSRVVGAATPDGATFAVTVSTGGPVRVAVADNASMDGATFFGPEAVDAQGAAKVTATGLTPGSGWWWQALDDGDASVSTAGRLRTHPPLGLPATFTIGFASCAGATPDFPGVAGGELAASRLSNSPIFDLIRTRALAENWLAFLHLGDMHYYDLGSGDHGIVGGGSLANYRAGFGDVLAQPRQHQLYREVAWNLLWDDHDFGPNNSDGTLATKGNAAQVYRERAPHYALPDASAIYHSFQIGRVLFIAADVRYDRSPNSDPDGPSKTMLGSAQKAWMETLLSTSDAKSLVWLMPDQWMATTTADSWASYATEQAELVTMFGDLGWLGRAVILGGDAHKVALDTGANSPGGIPVLHAASLDSTPGGGIAGFDLGGNAGREQYGNLTVEDFGGFLNVTLTGWQGNGQLVTHSFTIAGDPPPPLASGAFTRALTGSHRATFDARVLTEFQIGDDPNGVDIPILGGDVQMDGTADVQRTLELTTDDDSLWPRKATDLLAPYGNEVFVRRGVDFGSAVVWVPLGYFRIDTPEQDDAADGPIRLSCQDRMAGIVDGRLTEPRVFPSNRTVAAVFAELVGEIYPSATVLFDDATGSATLGREIISGESRYELLRDLADSHGKLMFWDGEGILRIVSAPDPGTPVWLVNAGIDGVKIRAGRRITRVGVYNGVVATGEGAGDVDPVHALAVDANPVSPTFWGGRFGRVPRFYSSPLLTNSGQAGTAARAMLRRAIGMPYNVDFQAVVNPALLPFDPIEVVYNDGYRQLHIIDTLTIPLDAATAMSGTTREQTLIQVEV